MKWIKLTHFRFGDQDDDYVDTQWNDPVIITNSVVSETNLSIVTNGNVFNNFSYIDTIENSANILKKS